ncbi:MAG: ABC transporter ATP-binding protein [bacterium]|nr:ABC transporter ATP-binding protein [bacterium]
MTAQPLRFDAAPKVSIDSLTIADPGGRLILSDVSLEIAEGTTVGIVGESGSGKSTLLRAILGAVHRDLRVEGAIAVDGTPILGAPRSVVARLRREGAAYLGQDPPASLTPSMRVEQLIAERIVERATFRAITEALHAVQLPADREFRRRRPYQLSGGQQQRLALARALANRSRLLLLDEPTTSLDVVTQAMVLDEIARQQSGRTTVIVSHDLAVVAQLADWLVVLRDGEIIEQGPFIDVVRQPASDYLAEIIDACPDLAKKHDQRPAHSAPGGHHLASALKVDGLRAAYETRSGSVVAAADVSFDVHPGECVALVGASGSGKSTIARSVIGVHAPEAGTVRLADKVVAPRAADRTHGERRRVQLIAQDPWAALNPRRRVGAALARSVERFRGVPRSQAGKIGLDLFERVGLHPDLFNRHPDRLSGGERQRVAIAIALAAEPDVLICDESTSALDVSIQAGVLDLLAELQRELSLGVLFITHDLGVVARIADRVLVLDDGKLCEHGTLSEVFDHPHHEMTRHLLSTSPSLSATLEERSPSHIHQHAGGKTLEQPPPL